MCCLVLFIFSSFRHPPYCGQSSTFSFVNTFFYRLFPSTFSLLWFCFSLECYTIYYFPIRFPSSYVCLHSNFKYVSGNAIGKSAKDGGPEIYTDVILYEERDGWPKIEGSWTISGAGVTNPKTFQRGPLCADLRRRSGPHLIVIKAATVREDSFFFPYH